MLDDTSNCHAATSEIILGKNESLYMAANFSGLGGLHGHALVRTLPLWMDAEAGSVSATKSVAIQPARAASNPPARSARVCALLSGQGAQSSGMMKPLYDAIPEIKTDPR